MTLAVVGFAFMAALMLGVPLLLGRSARRRRLRLGRARGAVVLRMPRGHNAILGTMLVLPCALFAALALSVEWKPGSESSGWVLGGFMGLLGALAGGYLFALEVRGRVRLDESWIEKVGAIRRVRARWSEVEKLTFNPMNRWFFLTVKGGARIYLVEGLEGIADFAELALDRLPPAVLAASPDATEELRELAAVRPMQLAP
jgi:hypothetical protein